MTIRFLVLGLCWATLVACGITSVVVLGHVVDDVNLRLPKNARFSWYGWYAPKYLRLLSEYRRLYPSGRHARQLRFLSFIMMLSAASAALALGFNFVGAGSLGAAGCLSVWLVHRDWHPR
jgi:hypothetical protein